jgi:predicted cation transporter
MADYLSLVGLALVMGLTLVLPFAVRRVEKELEAFLLVMGITAVSLSSVWSVRLVRESLVEPLAITATVAGVGWLFRAVRSHLKGWLSFLIARLGLSGAVFTIVVVLGLGSGVLTAIVAAIILAEVVTLLKLDRKYEIQLTVYACYAIGLGASLTPLGEPLSTIVVSKLKGPPHDAGFWYLLQHIGVWVAPGVVAAAAMAARGAEAAVAGARGLSESGHETGKDILLRALRVYAFVMALIFLGAGLRPLAERFMAKMPTWALFWANSVSAIVDNATLVAAEVTPAMTDRQITFVLMGLLISGGMLIPGNIPNIIASAKLGIKSREWARAALPFGASLMLIYFVVMSLLVK